MSEVMFEGQRRTMKSRIKTILFVEDNPLVLMSYRGCLQQDGFQVEAAGDGEAALAMLPQLKPDLVILDIMLPKINGLEVFKFIRGHSQLKDTPILVLSNAYMDEQAFSALGVGAHKRMLKTQCTRLALLRAVREMLGMPLPNDLPADDAGRARGGETDKGMLQQTRDGLLKDAPAEIARIRDNCLAYVKAGGAAPGVEHLNSLYQRVQFLCVRSGLGECTKIAHLASALEAMLFEIIFKKNHPTPSCLQTIAQAVDCLGRLFQHGDIQTIGSAFKARVLIVDDDPICNFVTVKAMQRARLEAASTQDPAAALEMAQAGQYDMVLLDVNMPGLNGFEVCEKLRLLPGYRKTPVIFVTACGEFQSRAKAVLSGGDDLITKPISPLELAVKTIIHLVEPQEQPGGSKSKPANKTPSAATPAVPSALEQIELHAESMMDEPESEDVGERKRTNRTTPTVPPIIQPASGNGARPAPAARVDTEVVLRNMLPPDRKTLENKIPAPGLIPMQPRTVQRTPQPPKGMNREPIMKTQTENLTPVEQLSREVARIMFGDGPVSDVQHRLTRIALEHYKVPEIVSRIPSANGDAGELFEGLVREVARIFFGDNGLSEMHLRLTRIALEHQEVPSFIMRQPETNARGGLQMHAATESLIL